jgi:hypothetical protein
VKRVSLAVMFVLAATLAQAQTVTNPTAATFTASADHAATLTDGTQAVTSYELACMASVQNGALAFTKGLGKPTPDATNTIGPLQVPELRTLSFGTYVCTAAAVGPGGKGVSAPSNPFNSVPSPGAPGAVVIR